MYSYSSNMVEKPLYFDYEVVLFGTTPLSWLYVMGGLPCFVAIGPHYMLAYVGIIIILERKRNELKLAGTPVFYNRSFLALCKTLGLYNLVYECNRRIGFKI